MLGVAFESMAILWPREQCQRLYDIVVDTTFATHQEDGCWEYEDQTEEIVENIQFHQLTITIHDNPSLRFHNLKLLLICKKPGLDVILYVCQKAGRTPIWKLNAKMLNISYIVGKDAIEEHHTLILKIPSAGMNVPKLGQQRYISER